MDCEAQAPVGAPAPCLIADLRDIPLHRLAGQAADVTGPVAAVVRRVLEDPESPTSVQVMTFNSAI